MKVAVIKIGSRISFNGRDTSGGNGEARSIIRMLERAGAEVHIFTKILDRDELPAAYSWHNLSDPDLDLAASHCDALIVLNGTYNCFGGAEDREQLLNYVMLNSFAGPVFYILCDPELTLRQAWPTVEKKPWAAKWQRDQLEITRKDIIYLSQPADVQAVAAGLGSRDVQPARIIHFPFEQFPCLGAMLRPAEQPTVDLAYGGTMRGGRREKKMVKFYFGHPSSIDVEMFGKISLEDFKPTLTQGLQAPRFSGSVNYSDMHRKMNSSLAHCVIGDPWYEKINDVPQRTYESIWSGVVTFIDVDMDRARRVYGRDRELADFLYVQDRRELSEKLLYLKEDPTLRHQILKDQLAAVRFDADAYCDQFLSVIAETSGRA